MRKLLLLSILLLIASPALANVPSEVAEYIHADKPYGTGRVTFALFTVYDAALWTDAKPFSMDKPFALTLTYRHAFSASALIKKTADEMARIDQVPADKLQDYSKQLAHIWPNVSPDDVITAVNLPGDKTVFYYNGKLSGAIKDPAFNKAFFDIWLSTKTSEPTVRKTLLSDIPH
jgi:hypothetical protein